MFTQKRHPYFAFITILCFALGLTGCEQPPAETDTAPVELVRPAKIFEVADPAATALRHFPAEVEADADSKLAFRVSGQIIELPIRAGDEVVKGQLLAKLDPRDFKLRLDDRQARYELAHSQFQRAKTLLSKKLASQSDYDEAKANLAVALSTLDAAKTDLEYTELRAPFSGSIAMVTTENHENIQAKQTIMSLQSLDHVDLSIQIPEDIISRVNKDTSYQPTVRFDTHPNQPFLVTFKEFDTQADPSTLTYKVVFSMPNPETFNVLPGMSANIIVDLAKVTHIDKQSYLLPVESVFSSEESTATDPARFVWKMDPVSHKVSRVRVTVGEIKRHGIEVFSGVNPGDQIVAAGVHYLREGMQVRPWDREKGL